MVTERRRFLATASSTLTAVAAAALVDAPNVIAQPKVQWRMSTAWTPSMAILQGAAGRLAKVIEEMSGGRFRIDVFPDHPAVRVLRRRLEGHHRSSHGRLGLLVGPRAGVRVVPHHPVRHEPAGHGRLVPPRRRTQAVGGGIRPFQPGATARRLRHRWLDGSGKRSRRSATTRASKCASPASVERSSPRPAPRRSSSPAPRSMLRSNEA